MSSFINHAVSLSAAGFVSKADTAQYDCFGYNQIHSGKEFEQPFFAMTGQLIDQSEQRLFSILEQVVEQLILDAKLTSSELESTAVIVGSTSLDIGTIKAKPEQDIWLTKTDRLSAHIQQKFSLSEFHLTINTACTASINAVMFANRLITQKQFERVIVVGCEFYNPLTVEGFHSLDLINPTELKAFHQDRNGLILGEGVAALLLSGSANDNILEILDGYSGCDTYSLTMTNEDGSHISQVITKAIETSGLSENDIDLVKVHGTATQNNDIAEFNGLAQSFKNIPDIFALKPFIGHTLGACGAVELALMVNLIAQQADIPLPPASQIEQEKMLTPYAKSGAKLTDYQHVLINHCGFGGNNAAVVVKLGAAQC